jgi:hypothetical protein
MARISYQRQVQANNLPNVEISNAPARYIAAAGEAMSKGLGDLGSAFGGIAAKEQEKANVAAQMEIENQLSGLENETLHAPETGLLNTQGKDAIGAGQRFAETWGSRESEIISRAPRQIQQWAKQRAADRRLDGERMLMRHSTQEGDKYYAGQANGVIANAEHTATLNYLDPDRVEKEAARAMIAAEQLANLTGADETSRRMMSIQAASKVNRAVLERMIADNPDEALTRLERVRGQMTGDDLTRIESVLRPVLIDSGFDSWLNSQTMGGPERASELPVEGAAQSLTEVDAVARASVGRTVGLESRGVATAKNPRSSATGAGQFIDKTWLATIQQARPDLVAGKTRAQVLALRNDPVISKEMTEAYAVANARGLYDSGLPVTEQTVYLAHHFGLGGARKILRASPNTPMQSLISPSEMQANPYLKGKTVGQVIANHEKRAGESPTATNSSRTQPASVDGKRDWVELERRAQSIPNKLVRDRYVQRLRSEASLEARQEAQADKQMSEQMLTAINADPNAPLARALGPDLFAKARNEGKLPQLETYRENMAKGGMIQDDYARVDELERMAATDPAKFLSQNIAGEGHKFSTATLSSLLDKQKAMAKPSPNAGEGKDAQEARVSNLFRMVGVGADADAKGDGSGAKNEPRARHRGELRIMYRNAITEYTQANSGKPPTPEKADEISRNVARIYAQRVVSSESNWFGPDTPITMMQENDRRRKEGKPMFFEGAEQYALKFTEQQRASVRAAYVKKYKVEPTETWVRSYLLRATSEQQK